MASNKDSKTSKTAHVMNLLSKNRNAEPAPAAESPAPQSSAPAPAAPRRRRSRPLSLPSTLTPPLPPRSRTLWKPLWSRKNLRRSPPSKRLLPPPPAGTARLSACCGGGTRSPAARSPAGRGFRHPLLPPQKRETAPDTSVPPMSMLWRCWCGKRRKSTCGLPAHAAATNAW